MISWMKKGLTRNDFERLGDRIGPVLRVIITVWCHGSPGVNCAEAVSVGTDMSRRTGNKIV
jgi:hypothetical protein